MRLGAINLGFRFDGPAGLAQDGGLIAEVVRQLGDDYPRYHAQLVVALKALGGRPVAEAYPTPQDFASAWVRAEEIVNAEAALRMCRAYRVEGKRLSSLLDLSVPLVDGAGELVDVTAPLSASNELTVEVRDDPRMP